MIFTRSSGWLSLSVQLCLKRCKILATSGHRILPFPLLWMPGETLGHRSHRSVRTPYGPSSCKLVQAWSRTLHSAECGVPQVTSFSIQVSLHDDSASLCGANWAHNEGTIGVSTMPKPQSNCNEPCMEVLTLPINNLLIFHWDVNAVHREVKAGSVGHLPSVSFVLQTTGSLTLWI